MEKYLSMAKKKFSWYAVRKGRTVGIFRSWFGINQAHEQIDGFPKAEFKGFYSRSDAEAYMRGSNAVLKRYEKLVDKLVAGDDSVKEEAVRLGNQLRESSADDGKVPWED